MKHIMIIALLAFMSGHASADNLQEVDMVKEKLLTAKEIVTIKEGSVEISKDLPKEEKVPEIADKASDKNI